MKADAYNARALQRGDLSVQDVTTLVREFQTDRGLRVDGCAGPRTIDELRSGIETPSTALEVGEPPDQSLSPSRFEGPLERIPTSRREITKVAGDPGVGGVDRSWKRRNIVSVRGLPGLPWWRWVSIHRLVEPYLREALRRALEYGSLAPLTHCGGFVYRHIRNDRSRPLSLHAYGWAVDLNPKANGAKRFMAGQCPRPFGKSWRDVWPDDAAVDEPLVKAFESVGFTWGGVWGRRGRPLASRASAVSFSDPMRFELRDRAAR